MKDLIVESLKDESGKQSNTRLCALLIVLAGVSLAHLGLLALVLGATGVTPYIAPIVGLAWGSGAGVIWSSQSKSAKISTGVPTPAPTTPITPLGPAAPATPPPPQTATVTAQSTPSTSTAPGGPK